MPRPLSVAIQQHLVDWRARAWPVDWTGVFGREAPLALEIGFGNGQFLLETALARPDRDHLGLELSWSSATRLMQRLGKHQVRNARGLLVDAELALRHLFVPESLDEVYVNHPCPWPKARHVERRVLNPTHLALVADRMRLGAKLTVVTDHAEYATWLAEVLTGQDSLVSCHDQVEAPPIPGREPTKYQLKAMRQGVPIHFFEWRKERVPAVPPPPVLDPDGPMPSLTLRGETAPDADLFATFTPTKAAERHDGVDVVVVLQQAFRRVGAGPDAIWMVEVLVREGELRQDFAIQVVRRASGDLLVKLSGLGRPHPTHGVKRAVHAVGAWLRSRHPGLALAHHNLGDDAVTPLQAEAAD